MKDKGNIWEPKAATEDYIAAQKYLTLLFAVENAKRLVKALRAAPTTKYAAKDLLRASKTHLLEKDSPHVADDLKKIKKGKKLSPVLLVRGNASAGLTLTIADGYHRICASWHWDETCPLHVAWQTSKARLFGSIRNENQARPDA